VFDPNVIVAPAVSGSSAVATLSRSLMTSAGSVWRPVATWSGQL
jgi:hypothetical protein